MQTFTFDISVRGVTPVLNVKQGDVGRKFKAVITDCGAAYSIPSDAQLSVWYSGPSGQGNYSVIGENSAFFVSGSTVTVEMIAQMLTNHGQGAMCLVLNSADGSQIGLWNVIYVVEAVPGMNSQTAEDYYTALSELAQQAIEAAATFETDPTLTVSGKAADAAQVGTALAGKAPAGYGLGTIQPIEWSNIDNITANGWYSAVVNGEIALGVTAYMVWVRVDALDTNYACQTLYATGSTTIMQRYLHGGTWSSWIDTSPSAFAPAGYGLGELTGGACADCNTAVRNGWYNITGSTTNPPVVNSVTHNVAVMLVMGRSSRIWQTVYSYTNTVHAVLQRTSFDSGVSWNDWEWVHPPMTVGVEYRTTERWQGKAVYAKLVDFGEVPVDSSKSISYSLGATNIVDGSVIMNGNTILPYDYLGVSVKVNNILTSGARITGAGNSAGSTAVIKLKYTKD